MRGGALEHHDVAEDAIPLDEPKRVLRLGRVPDRLDEVLIGPVNGRGVPKGKRSEMGQCGRARQ